MAFVFREERKTIQPLNNRDVGPGSYHLESNHQAKVEKKIVPFGTTEQKIKESTINNNIPGPGSYIVDNIYSKQKVIVTSESNDIKILEVVKPQSVFKSTTHRFEYVIPETPGPGQYYKQRKFDQTLKNHRIESQKNQIIQQLMKMSKYQPIPSIPSNVHAYGYNQNQKNQLLLNQSPNQIIKGEKNDTIGPGHYNINNNMIKSRGISWNNQKTVRNQEIKPTLIGPGSYDLNMTQKKLFNYKPSPQFSPRTNYQRATYQNKTERRQSRLSDKIPNSTQIESDNSDQYQYTEDSTPGPGSYLFTQNKSKPNTTRTSHFGSTAKRFQEITKFRNPVGPGQYEVTSRKLSIKKKKIPFEARESRFQQQKISVENPGPGYYQPRNALEDRLIFRIQRGYRGQFGTTQDRFKYINIQNKIGPGSYNPQNPEFNLNQQGTTSFKSKTKKGLPLNQDVIPPPGFYKQDYFDISHKVIKQEQQDPDLIVKKPGFNIGAQRFKYPLQKPNDSYDDNSIIEEIQRRVNQTSKYKPNNAPFNSKETRLKFATKQQIGPGEYNTEDRWNKKTYNILFADI